MLDTLLGRKKSVMVTPEEALPGSDRPRYRVPERHEVLGTPIGEPYPAAVATTPGTCQNFRSAPQKQPRPKSATSVPAG